MALGTWVDFPQPVFPLTTRAGLDLSSPRMAGRCLVMGRESGDNDNYINNNKFTSICRPYSPCHTVIA